MGTWQPTSGEKSALWGAPEEAVKSTWSSIQRLQEDHGIHQIVDVADHVSHGHDLARLVKRCLISSSFVVLKTPSMLYRKQGPDEYLCGLNDGWDMSPEQQRLEALLAEQRLHGNEFCVVLPASMQISVECSGGDALDGEFARADEMTAEIQRLERYVYTVPVGADYATVRRLLKQDHPKNVVNTGLLMPDIRNLSLQDLTALRKDHDDAFSRLRYALKRVLDGVAEADSERKFVSLVEEVDHECRKAEDEFHGIKRKHSSSLKGMLVTTSLVAIAAATEHLVPGMFAAAVAALGSVTLKDVVERRVVVAEQAEDMKKSDYWIAWKIHEENRRRARS